MHFIYVYCFWIYFSNFLHLLLSPVNQAKFAVFKGLNLQIMKRLEPGEWLNDDLVNSGIKHVHSPPFNLSDF